MELLRTPVRCDRHFAGKALAVNAGYAHIRQLPHEFIVCLDADVSFAPDYFAFLLAKLAADSQLGIVGTSFREGDQLCYDYRFMSTEHVSGPCQMFRRQCFDQIGGYTPQPNGGVDDVAVLTARMKGWKTRCFTEKCFQHLRPMGLGRHTILGSKFAIGRLDHALANHPLWELFRAVYQMSKRPILLGGLCILAGYFASFLDGDDFIIPLAMIQFRRREQMTRLKRFLSGERASLVDAGSPADSRRPTAKQSAEGQGQSVHS
jgi:glycosyltransferase involved in cell wall biosynthesis